MLELSGNAQIKQGSDTFRAQEITLNMDSQEITLDGRVKGSIVDERKSEAEDVSSDSDASGSSDISSDEKSDESANSGEPADKTESANGQAE